MAVTGWRSVGTVDGRGWSFPVARVKTVDDYDWEPGDLGALRVWHWQSPETAESIPARFLGWFSDGNPAFALHEERDFAALQHLNGNVLESEFCGVGLPGAQGYFAHANILPRWGDRGLRSDEQVFYAFCGLAEARSVLDEVLDGPV